MRLLNVDTFTFKQFYTSPPPYVIASHRWADDAEEITYQDVLSGRDKSKAGYKKLRGLAEFIQCEYLNVFEWLWIDTCCIDKTNAVELSEAINCMFRWYRDAEVCLAYLPDVTRTSSWIEEFQCSEWFSRGWTLQELIAPRTIIFLTVDWAIIGYKGNRPLFRSSEPSALGFTLSHDRYRQLDDLIATFTSIPLEVLSQPGKVSAVSAEDRLRWATSRVTTREEDKWYCLFGLLETPIGANYGEGAKWARKRLLSCLEEIGSIEKGRAAALALQYDNMEADRLLTRDEPVASGAGEFEAETHESEGDPDDEARSASSYDSEPISHDRTPITSAAETMRSESLSPSRGRPAARWDSAETTPSPPPTRRSVSAQTTPPSKSPSRRPVNRLEIEFHDRLALDEFFTSPREGGSMHADRTIDDEATSAIKNRYDTQARPFRRASEGADSMYAEPGPPQRRADHLDMDSRTHEAALKAYRREEVAGMEALYHMDTAPQRRTHAQDVSTSERATKFSSAFDFARDYIRRARKESSPYLSDTAEIGRRRVQAPSAPVEESHHRNADAVPQATGSHRQKKKKKSSTRRQVPVENKTPARGATPRVVTSYANTDAKEGRLNDDSHPVPSYRRACKSADAKSDLAPDLASDYQYGRDYFDDLEYPTPAGYRTSVRPPTFRQLTRSPSPLQSMYAEPGAYRTSARDIPREYANDLEYPTPASHRTSLREPVSRRLTRSPSPMRAERPKVKYLHRRGDEG